MDCGLNCEAVFALGVHSRVVHTLQLKGCTYEKLDRSINSKFERLFPFRGKLKMNFTESRP